MPSPILREVKMSTFEIKPEDDRNPYRALVGSINNFEVDASVRVEPPFSTTEGYFRDPDNERLVIDVISGQEATFLSVDFGVEDYGGAERNRETVVELTERLLEDLGRVASSEMFIEYIKTHGKGTQ